VAVPGDSEEAGWWVCGCGGEGWEEEGVEYPFAEHGFMDANFMLDPAHYGLIAKITDEGSWRVSYGCPGSLSFEEIERALPEKLEQMLPGPRPLRYRVQRVAPYKAQQRRAEAFTKGRMLLLGDAAHSGLLALLYPLSFGNKGLVGERR